MSTDVAATGAPVGLTAAQYEFLTGGLQKGRVSNLRGQSHLEAWDVRRHLIRAFGFGGFDIERRALDLVAQIEYAPGSIKKANGGTNDRTVWTVIYRAELRLIIKDGRGCPIAFYDDGACGDSANQPVLGDAHDHAMKTALSQALKRCAVNLGDQFGLSLYNDGSATPVVQRSLMVPAETVTGATVPALPQDDPPVVSGELDQPRQEEPPPDDGHPVDGPSPRARALFEAIANAPTAAALKVQYDQLAPALEAGEITRAEAKQLSHHVKNRKAKIGAVTPATDRPDEDRSGGVAENHHRRMHVAWGKLKLAGESNREARLTRTSLIIGRDIDSSAELTRVEAEKVTAALEAQVRELAQVGVGS